MSRALPDQLVDYSPVAAPGTRRWGMELKESTVFRTGVTRQVYEPLVAED
jgi:hypothetical protein